MKRYLLLFISFSFCIQAFSQSKSLKRELRGAWVATFSNIDWPVKTQTPQVQRDAFITLINQHQATGINVLYVQIRSQSDAMYPSAIEPWSADLTGTQGVAPSPLWDPMQFMIDECHKRGMEFHAWINPYRVISDYTNNYSKFSSNHVVKKHPEWLLSSGILRTLDPGLPQVRNYIETIIADIVSRYDIDGIHFDDYFYPNSTSYDDSGTFSAYNRGFSNVADWRRDNVNLMIKQVSDKIISLKPWVKFGISPSGIYRNSTNPAIGSPTSGLEHYSQLYADSKKWLQEGWIDYLIPQVYWYIGQSAADYSKIVPWWNNNSFGRHIYIGLAGYKVNDASLSQPEWLVRTEIPNQMRINRAVANANIYGQVVYNTKSMNANPLNFRDSLRVRFYNKPALIPAMPWKDNVPPAAPQILTGSKSGNSFVLNWIAPPITSNEFDVVKRYVVYRSVDAVVDITSPDNILAIISSEKSTYTDLTAGSGIYNYAVTALDRFSNESAVSNILNTLRIDYSGEPPLSENASVNELKIYPNPVSNEVNISFPENYGKRVNVKILDLTGKIFYNEELIINSQGKVKIDLQNKLSTGQYVLLVNKNNAIESFKLLVL